MLQVIACPRCGMAKICSAGTASTRCSHCSKPIRIEGAVVHYSGENREKAAEVVFSINARAVEFTATDESEKGTRRGKVRRDEVRHSGKKRGVDEFLSERSVFSALELASGMYLKADEAETLIAKLLESGRIIARRDGDYAVVT